MRLNARLKTLERQHRQIFKEPLRIVVTHVGKRDLSKATCSRTMLPSGHLMEIVDLKGSKEGLTDEDLEDFIQSFPVDRPTR